MIYVCIPSYNEARTLGVVLWKVRQVMADFERDFRILVFDDASTDDTRDVLIRYQDALPLKAIRAAHRMGYGKGVESLVREALAMTDYPKRDVIVVLQADLTDDPASIPELVKPIEGGADVVTGVLREEGRPPPGRRVLRWLAGFALGGRVRSAPATDPFSGFRAYRMITLRKAIRDREDPDADIVTARTPWGASLELLELVVPHARRMEEAEVGHRHALRRRESRTGIWSAVRGLVGLRRAGPRGTSAASPA